MSKTKLLLVSFLLHLCYAHFAYSQDEDQYLVVNPIGHKGQIRDIVVSKDQKYIVSAGFDKSIKKWDIELGEVVMEYRSEIGIGSEGMVYFIDLSPDNKYLAACGWFGNDDETEDLGDIRIFDFETGKLVRVIKGLTNPPYGVYFSADSKSVISGDYMGKIYRWDILSGEQIAVYDFHESKEYQLIELTVRNDFMMSTDKEGNVCLWDLNKPKKPTKIDSEFLAEVNDGISGEPMTASNLAISPTLEHFAYSTENFIVILNKSFEVYFGIENNYKPGFLKFSADGKRLLTGCVARGTDIHAYVFEIREEGEEEESWVEIADFDYADASIIAGDFFGKDQYVSAGGENNYIYIWSGEKDASGRQKTIQTFKTNSVLPYAAGLKDWKIAYADTWSENFGMSAYTHEFDINLRKISSYSGGINSRPDTAMGDYSIKWCRTYGGLDGLTAGLEIKYQNQSIDTIERDETNGSRHTVYTFLPNQMIATGGDYGYLEAYTNSGTLRYIFVGHTGLMNGLSVSEDGKRLISASDDNTIKIWPLDKLVSERNDEISHSVYDYLDEEQKEYPLLQKYIKNEIKHLGLTEKAKLKSVKGWEEIIEKLDHEGDTLEIAEIIQSALESYSIEYVYPLATFFVTKDEEWLLWNKDGYFMSSRKGAKYVGYHINQGKEKEATYYPFEQFDIKYNRPDIILKDLSMASQEVIDGYYKAYQRRLKKMGLTEEELSNDIHAPKIVIDKHVVNNGVATVTFSASDTKYALKRLNVYINDVPIYGTNGKVFRKNFEQESIAIPLANGLNKVQMSVLNDKGQESLKETLWLNNKQSKPNKLFVLTIGVSDYKDSKFKLNYAAKDATDIADVFSGSKAFSEIEVKTLTDAEVTREAILELKETWLSQARIDDMIIVFIAGHGVLDKDLDYYFAPYDMNFTDPKVRGISYAEIESLMDGIQPLKKLLFMDSCHSGELEKDEVEISLVSQVDDGNISFRNAGKIGVTAKSGIGIQEASELAANVFLDLRKGTGTTVISSAGGVEFAMESDRWKNGLFTYCLLNGITTSQADLNNDGKIFISELQKYVGEQVQSLSGGNQMPTFRRENLEFDYRIW